MSMKLVLGAAALLGMLCSTPLLADNKSEAPPHLVESEQVSERPFHHQRHYLGDLTYHRQIRLHNQEAGLITQLSYYPGDQVTQKSLLVEMDDRLLRAELGKASATRNQAALALKRIQNLNKQHLASDDELLNAQTTLEVAKSEEQLFLTRLSFLKIHAPFDGIIIERLVEPGDSIPGHTHLLTLADPDSLIVELKVSELLLPHLKLGMSMQATIDALGEQHEMMIDRIYPTLDPISRHGTVELRFKQIPPAARAGQLCRINLELEIGSGITVPLRALRRDREGEYLFVIDAQQKAQQRRVVTGLNFEERIEIRQGLRVGEELITNGFLGLRSGKVVQVTSP